MVIAGHAQRSAACECQKWPLGLATGTVGEW